MGIACEASGLYVVDCDHGLTSEEDFHAWRLRNNLPVTYTVRTGRRVDKADGVTPVFCVQMYYSGAVECGAKWSLDGCSGEIRSAGFYVCAAGSVHPDSGETYQVLVDAPLAPRPAVIEQAVKQAEAVARAPRAPGQFITENRNMALTSEIGKFRDRNAGVSQSITLATMLAWNDEEMACPLDADEVQVTVAKQYRQYPDASRAAHGHDWMRPPKLSEMAEKHARPIFPDEAWAGTIFGGLPRLSAGETNPQTAGIGILPRHYRSYRG